MPKRVEQGVAWDKILYRKMLGQLGRQGLGSNINHRLLAADLCATASQGELGDRIQTRPKTILRP